MLGGIRPGDQILSVNGIEFGGKSLEYVVEQMELLMENETIVILFFEWRYTIGRWKWLRKLSSGSSRKWQNFEFSGFIHESRLVDLTLYGEE